VQTIIRVEHSKNRPYLVTSKTTISELRDDWQALGMLTVLLAKPDEWRLRPEQLGKECGISESTVDRVLRRLIERGYVKCIDITRRLDHGHFKRHTHYVVFEDKAQAALFIPEDEQKAEEQSHRVVPFEGQVVPF
jgi:hypothetical protein